MASIYDSTLGLDDTSFLDGDAEHVEAEAMGTAPTDRQKNRKNETNRIMNANRADIEARTLAGETCTQIARALQAKGFNIHQSSVARKRLQWGYRQRETRIFGPIKRRDGTIADPNRSPEYHQRTGFARTCRKDEITRLTQQGKTAEEIAEILTAKGAVLKKGSSTVWRLQTLWKLIPYDEDRAKGKWRFETPEEKKARIKGYHETQKQKLAALSPEEKKAKGKARYARKKKRQVEERQRKQRERAGVRFYPGDCDFGPAQKKASEPNTAPTAPARETETTDSAGNCFADDDEAYETRDETGGDHNQAIQIDSDPSSDSNDSDYGDTGMAWHQEDAYDHASPTDIGLQEPPPQTQPASATHPFQAGQARPQPYRHAPVPTKPPNYHHQHSHQAPISATAPVKSLAPAPAPDLPIIGSSDIMSAEIILDLANSTAAAATRLKDLMTAVQAGRPAPGSMSALPPSREDLILARKNIVMAARSVMDLAGDEGPS